MATLSAVLKSLVPNFFKVLLRNGRVKQITNAYSRRVVRHSYSGFPLDVTIADPLAEGWYDHDWPAQPTVDLLRQHRLKAGARVFDIGAHQAVVAMMLARIVEPGGSVVALEASEHNFEIGQANISLNSIDNLQILHAAGSDVSGEIEFEQNFNGSVAVANDKFLCKKVKAYCVDDLATKYGAPQILFVDVEGFEVHVLKGAKRLLAENRPDCDIEVHVGCGLEKFGFTAQDVADCFSAIDYELFAWVSSVESGVTLVTSEFKFPNENFHLIAIARR